MSSGTTTAASRARAASTSRRVTGASAGAVSSLGSDASVKSTVESTTAHPVTAPAAPGSPCDRWIARRSAMRAGTRSSRANPSSRATTPMRAALRAAMPWRSHATSPLSSAADSAAALRSVSRSAIASSSTPPSVSASRPRCATGRPADSVAARSSPPSRRSSSTCTGMRRQGAPCGSIDVSSASQRSRMGPGAARSTTPPMP